MRRRTQLAVTLILICQVFSALTCAIEDEEAESDPKTEPSDCESHCPVYIRAPPPVCGDGKEYYDECRAKCAGASVITPGPCIHPPRTTTLCICPRNYLPVCGDGVTYPNECEARCAGATDIDDGPCPCKCPLFYKPVCGDGKKYANKCQARFSGAKHIVAGDCCQLECSRIYRPVVSNGVTYGNRCLAQCARRPPCPPCNVRCTNVYDPVCVNGVTTYRNECLTLCLCPKPITLTPGSCNP